MAAAFAPPGKLTRIKAEEYRINLIARGHHLRLEKLHRGWWFAYDSRSEKLVARASTLRDCQPDCLEYFQDVRDAVRCNLLACIQALDPEFSFVDFGVDASVADLQKKCDELEAAVEAPQQLSLLE